MAADILSKATVGAVGLLCKTFLHIGYCSSVTVNGLDNLRTALEDVGRNEGRGVITMCNHISTLDDPLVWGVLPARFYLSSRMTRWTLGASDIMFTNPIFSFFFRKGQVIETFRGKGIFQPAIDDAVRKLNDGAWIHLFCEGKVNQPVLEPARLLRFKWGVGRILMEADTPPTIIPMWLTGFDQLMPENRATPWKFFPRPRVALSVTFGRPIDTNEVREFLARAIRENKTPEVPASTHGGMAAPQRTSDEQASAEKTGAWLGEAALSPQKGIRDTVTEAKVVESVRSAVTALLQRKMEELGREVTRRRMSGGVAR